MEQQFKNDQLGYSEKSSNEPRFAGSLLEALGYDQSGKDYKSFLVFSISTDNTVISNAGQSSISQGTTITINVQEQNCVHWLDRYAIQFTVNPTNGYFQNYLEMVQSRQVQIGKKILSTGDSVYLQQMMFNYSKIQDLQKVRRGLGCNLNPSRTSCKGKLIALAQIPAGSDINFIIAFLNSSATAQFGKYFNELAVGSTLFAGNVAAVAGQINAQIVTPLNVMYNLQIPSIPVAPADAAALLAAYNSVVDYLNRFNTNQFRWNYFEDFTRMSMIDYKTGDATIANSGQYRALIPFRYLFPELSDICQNEYGGVVLTGGNTMQFQFDLQQAQNCMVATGANPLYTVSNLALVRCMSPELTNQQMANVNSITLLYSPLRGYPQSVQTVGMNNSLSMAIPYQTRAKAIYFAFFPSSSYVSQNNSTSLCDQVTINGTQQSYENLVGIPFRDPAVANPMTLKSRLFYPNGYSPPLPVYECILNVAGVQRIVNAYLVRNLDMWDDVNEENDPFLSEQYRQAHCVYKIDLTRFAEDLYGATLDPSPVNLLVNLQTNGTEYTVSGQGYPWTNNAIANGVCSVQQYQLRAYTILQEFLEMDHGVWKQ